MPASVTIPLPIKGLNKGVGYEFQPPETSPDCQNVLAYGVAEDRLRIGRRWGVSKWVATDLGTKIQAMIYATVDIATTSGVRRDGKLVVVADGEVWVGDSAGMTKIAGGPYLGATSDDVWLEYHGNKVYVGDDANEPQIIDPFAGTPTIGAITESAGSFPTDSSNYPRLSAVYRNRLVLAGIEGLSTQWYMSAVADDTINFAEDWDYAATYTPTMAVKGGSFGVANKMPQPITALVPVSDDYMIVGCDSAIYQFVGDPAAGGQVDLVSRGIGMLWNAATTDDKGNVYFGSSTGVYVMGRGAKPSPSPQSLTEGRLDRLWDEIDFTTHTCRLVWDVYNDGLHVFVTRNASGTSTHYFWSARVDGWFPIALPNDHGPLAACIFDGDAPGDRAVLLGGRDGYVRYYDTDASNDDGTAITAYAVCSPVSPGDMNEVKVYQTEFVSDSGPQTITYELRVGDTAEDALASGNSVNEVIAGGFRRTRARARGRTFSCKISGAGKWAVELIRLTVEGAGKVRT